MTDTTHEAPERIWADGNAEWNSGSWGLDKEFDNDVEYVRADLVQAAVAERDALADALSLAVGEINRLKSDRAYILGFNAGWGECLLSQNTDPVCVRHSFDGHGWLYADASNGSNWFDVAMCMPDAEPLYESQDRLTVGNTDTTLAELAGDTP